MYCSEVNSDIYVGTDAGKILMDHIRSARESVRIVSPYLSPRLVAQLIEIHKKNLKVELITSDDIEDFKVDGEKNIHKLIIQNRETDHAAVNKREQWKNWARGLTVFGTGLLAILAGLAYYMNNLSFAWGFVPITALFLIVTSLKSRIRKKRVYIYWYTQLFPFKVYTSPNKSRKSSNFIHSKIYLIDDRIAFLGSLNFTASGTRYNHETRISTQDPNVISNIRGELNRLMHFTYLPEKDIQEWGRQLYDEPIN